MLGISRNYSDPMDDAELMSASQLPEDAPPRNEGKGRQSGRQKIYLAGITLIIVVAVVVGTTLGVTRPGAASSQQSSATASTGASSPTPTPTAMQTSPSTSTPPTMAPEPMTQESTPPPTMPPTIAPEPMTQESTPPPTITSSTAQPTLAVNASTLSPGSEPYVCTGDDRLNHEEPLYSGQVLCSNNDMYVFGMHSDGRFIQWNVVDSNDQFEIYYTGQPGDWFILRQNGDVEIYNLQNELQWKREAKFDMTFATCLTEYPCPYMHLHDDGVLVLNWRDSSGAWQVHQFRQAYDL